MNKLSALLVFEFKNDFRGGKIVWSNILFSFIICYIAYVGFKFLDTNKAIGLIWVLQVFATIQMVSDNISNMNRYRWNYLHNTVQPNLFITSKLVYNAFFSILQTILIALVINLLFDVHVNNPILLLFIFILGNLSFVAIFTTTSIIGAKAKKSNTLNVLLGLPLIIPQLLVAINTSLQAVEASSLTNILGGITNISLFFLLSICFCLIIFPYLWFE